MLVVDKHTKALRPHLDLHAVLLETSTERHAIGLLPHTLETFNIYMQLRVLNPPAAHQNEAP